MARAPFVTTVIIRNLLAAATVIALSATACSSTPSASEMDGTQSSAISGVTGLFPTGVDNTGALLTVKTVDPHYTLTSTIPASSVYAVTPNPLWAADTTTGQWISTSTTGGTTNAPVGIYTFTTTFTVAAANTATVNVSGSWSCDNYCTASLNGVQFAALGNNTTNAYGTTGTFTIPTASAPLAVFAAGTNTLTFTVTNNGTTPSPVGLAVLSLTGGCLVDSACLSTEYCNTPTSTCTAKVANGGTIPTVTGHNPSLTGVCNPAATVGPDVCASSVCDTDNKCGYANSDGSCTPGTSGVAVCRSGVCDTDDKCGFANGDGTCTPATSGVTICRSGVCDTDAKCGFAAGDGTCTSTTASTVCRSGVCTAGLKCGCGVDSDCASTQYCDTPTATCTAKIANDGSIPTVTGHTPTLNGHCNPATTIGMDVCASGVCDTDDKCGYADGDGSCTPAASGVAVCRSGACSSNGKCELASGCNVDSDCSPSQYCNTPTSTCTPKIANGGAVPSVTGHTPALTGVCNPAATIGPDVCASSVCDTDNKCGYANGDGTCSNADAGTGVCRSGVCDSTDDKCGFADGDGPCTTANGATVCRSGACSSDGKCEKSGGCHVDADCASGDWCNESQNTCEPKLANGAAIPTDSSHTSPTLNGTCTSAAGALVCQSGVCDPKNNECGYANGDGPCTSSNGPLVCLSGACGQSGNCVPKGGCITNADCVSPASVCNTTTSTCEAPDGGVGEAGIAEAGAATDDGGSLEGGGCSVSRDLNGSPSKDGVGWLAFIGAALIARRRRARRARSL
jgi:hypothetical protein